MANECEIVRGTSFTLQINIVNQSGSPVDLTGYSTIVLRADKSLNATSPTLEKSVTAVSASSGAALFVFVPGDTSSLATGEYLAEVAVTIGSGLQITLQPFFFRILQKVKASA